MSRAPEVLHASAFTSVPDMWHHRVDSTPDAEALMFRSRPSSWETLSWRQAAERVTCIANALLAHGLDNEQRCVVVAETSAEWILTDLGILCAGGATTTIYPTSTSEECAYILKDSKAHVVFCGTPALVEQFRSLDTGSTPPRLIVIQGSAEGATSLRAFEAEGKAWQAEHPGAYEARRASIRLDHIATLMYTSGTTGIPKGVLLTHDAWVYQGEAIDALGMMNPADRQYLFLPLSHVFAKVMEVSFIRLGIPTVVDSSIDDLLHNLEQTQPTWMAAVPRVFERAFNAIVHEARQAGGVRYATFRWAIRVGTEMSEIRQGGGSPSRGLRLRWSLADRLVFQPIKKRFGGKMRFFISGGAPLSADIARFLHACDLLILEGYGLTESSAASCVNRIDDYRFGTVGPPLPGCEIRIADNGEVLIRGRGVMKGYHNLPEETAEAFTEDGWLRTGDIGHVLEGGHLRITDRLKDLIVTAGGKNIAPAHFEQRLCGQTPFIAHVIMHGDRRPFCSALIALDFEAVSRWARSRNLSFTDGADLNTKPEVVALVQAQVDVVNGTLPPFEQVRAFHLIDQPLSQEDGTLTATLKVKRAVVTQRHQSILDAFYAGTLAEM